MNLEEIVEEFLDRHRNGGSPSIDEYALRFPQLEDDIRATLPALALVERHKDEAQLEGEANDSINTRKEIGDYRLIAEIGRGGMGVVYEAEQKSLGRRVALKLLPSGLTPDDRVRQRFYREAQAAAQMHHGNIVPVFEVGEDDGQFFYAMQRIHGCGLDDVIRAIQRIHEDEQSNGWYSSDARSRELASAMLSDRFQPRRLTDSTAGSTQKISDTTTQEISAHGAVSNQPPSAPPRADLRGYHRCVAWLGMQAADALAYAHSRGVIHRDIKPSNLILDASGVIWVTDFGLAKAEDDGLTQSGELLGTVRYMSPERFRGECDASADIYSLGLTLYEMLAFRPAFEANDRVELMNLITGTEPVRLRAIDRSIPRDLASIVSKAIEKEPRRRYATAAAMAEDLHRYMTGQSISARPVSVLERGVRWTKRNRSLAALLFTIVTFIVLVAIIAPIALLRESTLRSDAEQARRLADRRTEQVNRNLYFAEMNLAGQAIIEPGGIGQVRELLSHWHAVESVGGDLRGWEWHFLYSLSHQEERILDGPTMNIWSVDFSPDGRQVVAVADDRTLTVWDRITGKCRQTIKTNANARVDWSPDGSKIASTTRSGEVVLWDAESLEKMQTLGSGPTVGKLRLRPLKWSPNGKQIAWWNAAGNLTAWDVERDRHVFTLPVEFPIVHDIEWNPEATRIALSSGSQIRLIDAGDGRSIWTASQDGDQVQCLSWSPDSTRIAAAGYDSKIVLWDASSGEPLKTWQAPDGAVWDLDWADENNLLATAHADRSVRLWDVETGRTEHVFYGHTDRVLAVQWSRDGSYLASGGDDLKVRIWNTSAADRTSNLTNNASPIKAIAWSPDGKRLVSGSATGLVVIREPLASMEMQLVQSSVSGPYQDGEIFAMDWSPDGGRIAWGQHDGTVHLWSGSATLDIHAHRGRVWALDWHPDSRRCVTGGADGFVHVWDALTGEKLTSFDCGTPVLAVRWSPDGQRVATAEGKMANIRSVDLATILHQFQARREVEAICWNRDGTQLATASRDHGVRLWDTIKGQQIGDTLHATGPVKSLHWNSDVERPRLAGASTNGTVRIWDTVTGKLALSLATPDGRSADVCWTSDGERLAAVGGATIHVWDATTSYRERSADE